MLPVSDLIDVARGARAGDDLAARSPLRFGDRRAPVVVWNVCQHCNMTCPHCYAAASTRPAPTDLSTDEATALVDDLAAAGVRVLIFSGGEPLLRPDILQLLSYARRAGLAPQLSTNGVLIDDAVAARLREAGVGYVGVSIDGPREFNDAHRGLPGGYDRALGGLRAAKAAGLRTGLRMTLFRANAPYLETMFATARDVGADRFYVSHLIYSGRGRGMMGGDDLVPAESRALLLRLFELADVQPDPEAPRVVTGSNDSDGVLLARWLEERYGPEAGARVRALLLRRGGNSAGEGVVAIDPRGRVHPDAFWREATLGDVRAESFARILAHPLRAQLRQRVERLTGRCGRCSAVALCRGSHRERALAAHGDVWASDPGCVLRDDEISSLASVAAAGEEAS